MSTATVPEEAFEHVVLPDMTSEEFRERIEAVPRECGIRAAFSTLVAPALARSVPDEVERYRQFAAPFPRRGVFSFQPMRELMVQLAFAGQLYAPDEPCDTAVNAFVESASEVLWAAPVMGPLVSACDNDIARLLEVFASNARLFYNHGSLSYARERVGDRDVAIVHYDGQPAAFLEMCAPGFWSALARQLDADVEIEHSTLAPDQSETRVRLP